MTLEDDVVVYPAHGAGSACGKNLSKETIGTIGDQKKTNYALRADMTKEGVYKRSNRWVVTSTCLFSVKR